ncbi:MAG: transcription elongation factor GreA [Bacteroidetes bacterium]|nr:transcription elongation factor GreA [Bacteroidota bacterium]
MSDIHYVTEEGLEKIKQELLEMRTKGRQEIARQIKEARDKGDLSENAEYDAAKEAQGLLELKISKLEEIVGNTRILDKSRLDLSRVAVMTNVRLKNKNTGKEVTYQLVSEKEADLKGGRISVTSPIGKGLLGKSVGEVVNIQVPAGSIEFEVLEISL